MNNLVNVIEANVVSENSHTIREIMIVKIDLKDEDKIDGILNENIRKLKSKNSKILLEIIGSSKNLDNFLKENSDLTILEIVRSGKVAI